MGGRSTTTTTITLELTQRQLSFLEDLCDRLIELERKNEGERVANLTVRDFRRVREIERALDKAKKEKRTGRTS